MKLRFATALLGGSMLAATGCLHPTFGKFNNNTSIVPPLGKITGNNNLPPAQMLMHPGPGVDGPGPGVLNIGSIAPAGGAGGPMQAGYGGCMVDGGDAGAGYGLGAAGARTSQLAFVGPDGLSVAWDVGAPGTFDSEPLIAPGRYNFPQGAIYRLKLTNIPGRPGVELYPTIEVGPATPRSEAYLAHNAIPIQFTEEDFDQVLSGNFVTKVIYLPDPEFQELALAGVETLVSTRLDPGIDPIVEADRRGVILGIIRIGNKDLEVPGQMGDGEGQMVQAGYGADFGGGACGPGCGPGGGMPGAPNIPMPPEFVAGMTAPQYGMPSVGTPIGLPGPPHIPLGHPAGLQKHVMTNHTKIHIPGPTAKLDIHVKQKPGFSYPKSPSHVHITEESHIPPVRYRQPFSDKHEHMQDGGEDCNLPGTPAAYGGNCETDNCQ